jgi:hypothetical protein
VDPLVLLDEEVLPPLVEPEDDVVLEPDDVPVDPLDVLPGPHSQARKPDPSVLQACPP